MKRFQRLVMLLTVCCLAASTAAGAQAGSQSASRTQATLDDIQATMGSIPGFFKMFPSDGLPGAWVAFKSFQLGNTELAGKYKELIGLAVASQIPCHYCVYFHTEAAKLGGASDVEISEAVAEASLTRFWSTVLNGGNQDTGEFEAELDRALQHMASAPAQLPLDSKVSTAAEAYKEIEMVFGSVPTFFKGVPESLLPGAWMEMKQIEMNPGTAIPNKYKSLISLAVASQIPCAYCVYADREFAELEGATEGEIEDAIGMAAMTRHWSTFLNGMAVDEKTFKKEVDAVVKHFTAKAEK